MNALVAQVPTITSLPAWARSFVSAEKHGKDGRTTFRSSRELTTSERAEIESKLHSVDAALSPTSEDAALTIITRLLMAFPAQDVSLAAMKFRGEGYLTALSEFPAWVIERATEIWLKREQPEGGENYAFAPSPPQLVRLCRLAILPARSTLWQLQKILAAKPWVEGEASEARLASLKKLSHELGMATEHDRRRFRPLQTQEEIDRLAEIARASKERLARASAGAAAGPKEPDQGS